MPFLAHPENTAGQPHLLHEHLRGVGALARGFAAAANPQLATVAYRAGLLHDLGKYREEFQEYLRAERPGSVDTHHAVYGAALAFQRRWLGLAFAIAGHHAGLHDLSQLQTLVRDEKYQATARLPLLLERFTAEVGPLDAGFTEPPFDRSQALYLEFYVRMLFSALVDADFLDTEAHFTGSLRPSCVFQPDILLQQLLAEKATKSSAGALNVVRHRIFQQCLEAAEQPPGFFSLTVPTGGGKTLASMAFALRHAERYGLRRIIVVIPYLSIIEQNAAQYRRIFDLDNTGIVIEHHSAVAVPEDQEERTRSPLEYAADNWDAPIIVTTSVQFIESLFANRPARCRKLHNIARAVVIFDEVQTLPTHLLHPLLNMLRTLQTHYGVSTVFATATQPAFRYQATTLPEGFRAQKVIEIAHDTNQTFSALRRVTFRLPAPGETRDWPTLAAEMAACPQALCVVNVRQHAFALWEALRTTLTLEERDTVFHLSSAMCAQHRFDLLGEERDPAVGTIRHRLRTGQPCRVISTPLIEAGVDVDFPLVWRAVGPLDAIVQAAGRCNREGRLQDAHGAPALGEVRIFRPVEATLPPGLYKVATGITETLLAGIDVETLVTDPTLLARYFSQLYQYVPTDYAKAGEEAIQTDRANLRFREVARKARVITDDTQLVIVPYGQGKKHIAALRARPQASGRARFTKADLQRLQRFMVNVRQRDFMQLRALGQLHPLLANLELYVLSKGFYHADLGLLINQRPMEDFLQ